MNLPERNRPDPDALLAQLAGHAKGRLKVYLGMAAGVGKTYAMLQAAQEDRKRGIDVVIGYLEPHGRAETEAMAEGLERVPTKRLEGTEISEFDLDAALERKPDLILVDEFAHTNGAGCRHAKRWQDVAELLQAGINVATTVNVQHLESLNDVVAQITGVRVGETIPDAMINEADEVELVDIPPGELIERLQEGKVYVPAKVDQALAGFFRKKNLLALRELALRHTADRVEEEVRTARAAEGSVQPWHTNARILVCVAPNKMATRVVRSAKRMADALHADLIAAFVESSRQAAVSEIDRDRAGEAMRLAESLGAQTITLSGHDISTELVRYAQSANVTTIVVGKPLRPKWREAIFGSVVDSLVRTSGDIDIHVITAGDDFGAPLRLIVNEEAEDVRGYLAACVIAVLATAASWPLDQYVSNINLVLVYLLGVAFVAARYTRRAAMLSSLLSVLAFNFFFVEPRLTFAVSDIQYVFTFVVMLIVALVVSTLTARLRDQSMAASERERRTAALFDLSRKLSSTRSRTEIGAFAADKIRDVFACDVAVLIRSRKSGELFSAPASLSGFEEADRERGVAGWVVDRSMKAGKGTDTLPGSEGTYIPLLAEKGCVGVLALKWDVAPPRAPSQVHLLEAFASQLAIAIERTNLAKDSHESSLEVERERLRNALLSSVSHDLRTPLAIITAAAEQLRSRSPENELADSIAEESSRLERQVRNLLDMTHLESGSLQLRDDWQSVEELIGSAVLRTEPLLGAHELRIELPPDLPLLKLDQVLMEQVFVNLLENAARHTPPETTIWISARTQSKTLEIDFSNDGPTLAGHDLEAIFLKFGRGSQSRGSGLGLAICRAIVEAHGGTIHAELRAPQGVTFKVSLPKPTEAPHV